MHILSFVEDFDFDLVYYTRPSFIIWKRECVWGLINQLIWA